MTRVQVELVRGTGTTVLMVEGESARGAFVVGEAAQ